jgi:hypothetical protein
MVSFGHYSFDQKLGCLLLAAPTASDIITEAQLN